MHTARRMRDIDAFHVMEVQERAFALEAQGRRIVHMEIGQPDRGAPPQVLESALAAIRSERLGYTSSLGLAALREAIARFYREHEGIEVEPQRIVVTTGASGAFLLAFAALLGPGDEVLVPDPCYPCTRHIARVFESTPVTMPVDHTSGYQPTPAQVRSAWSPKTRGLLLASPSNPAGTMIADEHLASLVDAVRERGGFTLVDEIYRGLSYGPAPRSALHRGEDVLVVNSFSKFFGMTGWRLGWVVAPPELVRDIEKLAQNLTVSPPAPAQYAALAAFRPDTLAALEERRAEFERRRDFLVPALRDMGFSVPVMPQGAFYVYAGCERFSSDSPAFAMELLDEAGVAVTPGIDFGEHRAARHVRFAYTCSLPDLREGVDRLARHLARGA